MEGTLEVLNKAILLQKGTAMSLLGKTENIDTKGQILNEITENFAVGKTSNYDFGIFLLTIVLVILKIIELTVKFIRLSRRNHKKQIVRNMLNNANNNNNNQ